MKNENLKAILSWIFVITISILMNSCSARKAEKNRINEESKTEATTESDIAKKEESSSNVDQKTTVVEKEKVREVETTYKPIDPTKEATVTTPEGKKHTLNNVEVVIKETDKDKGTKTDTSINSEITNKSELTDKSKAENKADVKKASEAIVIDKKEWSPVNLLWLFIPVLIVVFLYNKYKSKIWWV